MRVRVACCCHILNNLLLFIFIIVIFAENASFTLLLSHEIRIPTESTQRGHDITVRDFNYYY